MAQTKDFYFYLPNEKPGIRKITVSATANNNSLTKQYTTTFIERPILKISNPTHPSKVSYNQIIPLTAMFKIISHTPAKNTVIEIQNVSSNLKFHLGEVKDKHRVRVEFPANNLYEGNNQITLLVNYNSKRGEKFTTSQTFSIYLKELTPLQKIKRFFLRIHEW